jgi:hypothetical protein
MRTELNIASGTHIGPRCFSENAAPRPQPTCDNKIQTDIGTNIGPGIDTDVKIRPRCFNGDRCAEAAADNAARSALQAAGARGPEGGNLWKRGVYALYIPVACVFV